MSEQENVKKLLKEAVIYKKQGLFPQSLPELETR